MFIDDEEGTDDALLTHQTLIDTQERLGALLDLMPTGLVIHQMQGILYANQQALSLLQQTETSVTGKHFLDFTNDEVREECGELFMRSFMQDAPVQFPQIELNCACDGPRYIKATAGRLPWEGTTVVQLLLEDITELKLKADELKNLTFHDVLTGAFNRRYFIEQAEQLVSHALTEQTHFSLLIFDVDWFKQVNDTYGHLAGDEALKAIVDIWHANTRNEGKGDRNRDGKLARIGGEEFAIFLPDIRLEQACAIAERTRKVLEAHEIRCDEHQFTITASFGVTDLRDGDTKLDDLIRRADIALYRAKEKGRNRVESE